MNDKQVELLKLAIARLKDCKHKFQDHGTNGQDDYSCTPDTADFIDEQFAEDGAGGEALHILEELLKGL